MNIWFISDLHFGDEKILRYENRPFHNVKEMDKVICDNWNSVVKSEDKIFILGDLSAYDKLTTKKIMDKLNGYKILIMGNHDNEQGDRQYFLDIGFDEVILYGNGYIYKNFFLLSHEPLYMNVNMPYVNIHGHIHNNAFESHQYVNVSVERVNYTPIDFNSIINFIKS